MRLFAIVMFTMLAAVGGVGWYVWDGNQGKTSYRTAPVTRGNVTSVIAATGTIEPEEVIDVGAQVQGKIESLGIDPDPKKGNKTIDYGSDVEAGTVLAQIDNAVYKSQVDAAEANLARSKADLKQWEAKLHEAERDWGRKKDLHTRKVLTDADRDLAQSTLETAQAMLGVGHAAVNQAQASLDQAKISLSYTTIKSPVKGKIVDRRVNIGQTVVASLNAPSLFLIAKDLSKLQVWASVNEADIGRIYVGQKVTFTVDAFPRDSFDGVVTQRRLNAMSTQNVVTYTVVVSTDNPGEKLLPYLTANVQFLLDSRENVLTVPNAALRWRPKGYEEPKVERKAARETNYEKPGSGAEVAASGSKSEATPGKTEEKRGKNRKGKSNSGEPRSHEKRMGMVWVLDGEEVRSIQVEIGLTDGANTEVSGEGLTEDLQVVTGEVRRMEEVGGKSPFAPQFGGGRRGGGGGGRGKR